MFRMFRRLANRRDALPRYALGLTVRTEDGSGGIVEVRSEDVSERGIRLLFPDRDLSDVVGGREGLALQIYLEEEGPPLVVDARLVWAIAPPGGGTLTGWQFVEFKGRALRRFRSFIDGAPAPDDEHS
jgi:hypothetical protein